MESDEIRRKPMDESHDVYTFAGSVIGTAWEFPDGSIRRVEKAVQQVEREMGERMPYPELQFDHGPRLPAQGFKRRINPSDVGDIEPKGPVAAQVVESL